MKNFSLILSIMIFMLVSVNSFGTDKYQIDKVHSYVGFGVKHMVISTARGNFTDFSGDIIFDEADITKSSVEVIIKVASIDTDSEDRDNHLRGADFFDVENYPEMSFKSEKLEKTDDGLIMHGKFTMRGTTLDISIPIEFMGSIVNPWGKTVIAFEGSAELSREAYGMTWNKVIEAGGLAVGDKVKIELNIEAVKAE